MELGKVRAELAELIDARDRTIFDPAAIEGMTSELRAVNEELCTIRERTRECEQGGDFGPEFVELARSAYEHEERRVAIRRRIDERLESQIS